MKFMLSLLLLSSSIVFGYDTINLTNKNSINFNSAFSPDFVAKKQLEAMEKCSANEGSDIYVVLYTPGGSVSAGKLFFDTLNALPCNFHTITIFAASMGYQTVQNLGNRYILPSGILMSHRASIRGLSGEINGELDQILKLIKENVKELDVTASKRVGITLDEYNKLIADELWMTGNQAVSTNHADKVVFAKCDKDFEGTYVEIIRFFGIELSVEFSNCPLVTAPLSVNRSRKGKIIDDELDDDLFLKVSNFYSNLSNNVFWEK